MMQYRGTNEPAVRDVWPGQGLAAFCLIFSSRLLIRSLAVEVGLSRAVDLDPNRHTIVVSVPFCDLESLAVAAKG